MTPESTELPRQFGPYELQARIGHGGMGEVYRAVDTRKNRVVAIKLLLRSLSGDQQFRTRFRREADIAARLNDPHVLPIHDYGEFDGTLYMEMPFIEGRDLASIVQRGRLDPGEAVRITTEIASALDAAHAQGLLHRDVKPGNILLTERGFAYLTDFGIATQADQTRLTGTGGAVGSMGYMAPERFEDGEPTRAVDEYALACVLFEMLTGVQPYASTSTGAVIKAHLFGEIPPPSATGVSPELDAVIRRGLAKDPAQRFGSAGALATAAQRALSGSMDEETRRVGAATAASDPDRTHLASYQQPTREARAQGSGPHQGPGPGQHGPDQHGSRTGSGSKRTPAIVAAVVAAALVLAAVGYFAFGRQSNDDAHAGKTPAAQTTHAAPAPTTTAPSTAAQPTESAPSTATSGPAVSDGAPATVTQFLSELNPSSSEQTSQSDGDVTLAGHPYTHLQTMKYCYTDSGDGSRVSWSLAGKWERFQGAVGPTDDSSDRDAKGELKVYVDNKLMWQSQPMKVGDAPKKFDIPVHGGDNLVIATNDAGDACGDLASMGIGDGRLIGKNGVAPAPTAS